ncbi:MAG: hypothetical protein WEB09_03860 [Nitriliruptor sp.]
MKRPTATTTVTLGAVLLAFTVQAAAATFEVSPSFLQAETISGDDLRLPQPGGGDGPSSEVTVTVTWYLFNPGGQGRTELASEELTTLAGETYAVVSQAGTHEGFWYEEVDCTVSRDIKDDPGATRTGSGTNFTATAGSTHSVCLKQQGPANTTTEDAAATVSSGPTDVSSSDNPGIGSVDEHEDGDAL